MNKTQPPFSYDGLDKVIHERARLAILSAMMAHQGHMAFNDLKQSCGLTDGNLSRHLQVLNEAGLIELNKRFEGAKPLTTLMMTVKGRERFLAYVSILERVVKDAAEAVKNENLVCATKDKPELA